MDATARAAVAGALGMACALFAESAEAGRMVGYESGYPAGAIVISQVARTLYLIVDPRTAIAYPVAVAKRGQEWNGLAHVERKYVEPAWSPPNSVKRDHPELPDVVEGGSPHNPMGARAITLDRDEIAIHGTTQTMRASVGTAASYGCIRMYNEDVIDLFDRVAVGAPVMMTR
jgi:lipoprotein-anchoring transpeptidase ErfK/SrfK